MESGEKKVCRDTALGRRGFSSSLSTAVLIFSFLSGLIAAEEAITTKTQSTTETVSSSFILNLDGFLANTFDRGIFGGWIEQNLMTARRGGVLSDFIYQREFWNC